MLAMFLTQARGRQARTARLCGVRPLSPQDAPSFSSPAGRLSWLETQDSGHCPLCTLRRRLGDPESETSESRLSIAASPASQVDRDYVQPR